MGWERKRGKLAEFNRLLLGDRNTSYAVFSDDPSLLPPIRFVITLDADTRLPRESAQRLVGTLAHPLNQPEFDPAQGRVVEGYGVLQPRVSYHMTATSRSRFSSLLAASAGIDPYATAVSDHYMDLFGTGSFTGKGIYDLRGFEAATKQTFPENQILSHDLIEGNYARCGLVTDIELFDDFPPRYHAYARREHRWIRGDWQLLPWLSRTVPTADGKRPNRLPALERWKLFDNLRRSLVPPALVLLLVLGWTVLPGPAWFWTAVALAVPVLPLIQLTLGALVGSIRRKSFKAFASWPESAAFTAAQGLLSFIFLIEQARLAVDAVGRTLYRLELSRRKLLEWETAASTERRLGSSLQDFCRIMWPTSFLALSLALLVLAVRPASLPFAGPILALWILSPAVAYWISQPKRPAESPLTEAEQQELRRVARRTWHFFERFVGDEDQWLPPDNFQETPTPKIAHRTSPTNKGLLLLSTLAAHDFGFLSLRTFVDRLEKTFDTLERLDRYHGHFYNWYDTQTLQHLPPGYISTVDSGNLLGCLIALKQGLRELVKQPLIRLQTGKGLADTLGVAFDVFRQNEAPAGEDALSVHRALADAFQHIAQQLEKMPKDLAVYDEWLGKLDWETVTLLGRLEALRESHASFNGELETWLRLFSAQIHELRAELEQFAPWLAPVVAWERNTGGDWQDSALQERWRAARAVLISETAIGTLVERLPALRDEIESLEAADSVGAGLRKVVTALEQPTTARITNRIRLLADRADALAAEMDFRFLYKPDRHLFAIGCNLAAGRLDGACYDLLASEASLTSFLTIARGDAPRRHWFQLGRPFVRAAGRVGLLSWGGTMFEYLMPRLLLRGQPGTVLVDANETAIARQIEYGRQTSTPWGISESAYAARYVDGDYKYQSFGVPGLGLKRGLDQDVVVSSYATALAVAVRPREALENFRRLSAEGAAGAYGFYEAVDYTPIRVPKGRHSVVVRSFMAHHQGMSIVALANALLAQPMPRRFHAEPMVRAAELLLQERVPRDASLVTPSESMTIPIKAPREGVQLLSRRLTTATTPVPRTHLLSNSQYSVMVTNSGSGYSTWNDLDVTRWREDSTRDCWGQYVYLRDLRRNQAWSPGHHPVCCPVEEYEVIFSADKASFRRHHEEIETLVEIAVSPEHMVECRRVFVTNHDSVPRDLELTSYAEIVLLSRSADMAHPAFGKLFLETEWIPGPRALLCRRRPRAHDQKPFWAIHVVAVEGHETGEVQYETDRARFIGRGRTTVDPAAFDSGSLLSGTTGPVLDPIVSLRVRIRLEPGQTAIVDFTTGVAESRETALALADQYCAPSAVARVFELSWAHSQVEHRHRNWAPEDVLLFQRLGAYLIFTGTAQRPAPAVIAANTQGQPGLWRYGISGDKPILLARIQNAGQLEFARQLLVAHAFLRLKRLQFDLVLLNEQGTSYFEELHGQLEALVRSGDEHGLVDKPGGLFVRKGAQIPKEDLDLLMAAARVVMVGDRGGLSAQLERLERPMSPPDPFFPTRSKPRPPATVEPPPALELQFANGSGGFAPERREYCVVVPGTIKALAPRNGSPHPGTDRPILPPAPWINVVANAAAGFLISEAGSGYTWTGNSQGNRLTPWSNDPVCDPPGEVIYLRDEESGAVWCPTPLPIPSAAPTVVRHGQGYTIFERRTNGIAHELTLFVPPEDPVKLVRLEVRNDDRRTRRLAITYYAELVLGTVRENARMQVVTQLDSESGALCARNAFRTDFSSRVSFADVDRRPRTLMGDRTEFIGRNGSLTAPVIFERLSLTGRVGAAYDPCAAVQTKIELAPGERQVVTFVLGEADTVESARTLLKRYREREAVDESLDHVKARWNEILGTIQVQTPNGALDLLLNQWLPYQVLSCRLWARSAFYQSGGAYGFRDQLQDVMALVYGAPSEARAQILRAAAHQFVEGDVQHWWHPPKGRGVRTRFSDDLLWLPFVVAHYVRTTGDSAVLDERVHYIEGPILKPDQEEDYGLPNVSEQVGTLYEHCLRALDRGMRVGEHGLPLMGTGDWNDGMNRVGSGGKGESVWDAWFLIACQRGFAELADARHDTATVTRLRHEAESLRAAVEKNAWDGGWYRRAYFDDGTPLGSAQNDECQIDSIAQTWAVISGAGDPARVQTAMSAVYERLVRTNDRLILLFTPPFDQGKLEPGYIKGYVPGIRENGGQYTHAATWVVQATALLGQGRHAMELFDLLNPVRHADDPQAVALYKVEPYVVAADVYGAPPHVGRGGWTWYTGSASWLYRVGLETILGFQLRGNHLAIEPCIPPTWKEFKIVYRFRSATYHITVDNPDGVERGVKSVAVDGSTQAEGVIPLADDQREHDVRVHMGTA
jgi:cyclic beta-1,2-glucan synthetase